MPHCMLPVTEVFVVCVDLNFNLFVWFDGSGDRPSEVLHGTQFV